MQFKPVQTIVFLTFFITLFSNTIAQSAPKQGLSPEVQEQLIQMQQQIIDLEKKFEESSKKLDTAAPANPPAGYAGGFFIQSEDGNFKFVINGGVTLRYGIAIAQAQNDLHSIGFSPFW